MSAGNTAHNTEESTTMATATTKAAKPTAKPAAKKAAAAPAKKAAAAPAPAPKSDKADRDAARDAEIAQVTKLRKADMKWPEVAAEMGISLGKAQLLFKIGEARAAGVKKPTPAAIKKMRDAGESWDIVAVTHGITKGTAQAMYAEAGGDPHRSFIGKGGRYYDFAGDKPDAPAKPKAPAKALAKKAAAAKATPAGSPVFDDDAPADVVKEKLSGKKITVQTDLKGTLTSTEIRVKADSVKVGKQKDGTRVVQLTDQDSGNTRTIRINSIVKIAR